MSRIPNQERREASIGAVLSAARSLFVSQGYEYTSMSQIAKAAGLTKGAIYFYFKDKAELLDQLLDESNIHAFEHVIQSVEPKMHDPVKSIIAFVNSVAQLGVTSMDHLLLPVIMAIEFSGSESDVERKIQNMYAKWATLLENIIISGQKTGQFHRDLDVKTTAITLIGLVEGLLLQWYRLHDTIDGATLAKTARQITLNALLA
jgi:TetR/AcrR family acrAB operon transcriptional repressor